MTVLLGFDGVRGHFGGSGCKVAIVQTVVFTFEVGGGVRYTDAPKGDYSIFDIEYSGIAPRADITVGVFF